MWWTAQAHSQSQLHSNPHTLPPLVRVKPSDKARIPQRREYISLSPAKRPTLTPDASPPHRPSHGSGLTLEKARHTSFKSLWSDRLTELQYEQNRLLREENDLLRQEVVQLRALVDKQTQHLTSFIKSFEIFGDALQEGLRLLDPEDSKHLLTIMMTSLKARSPKSTCTVPSISHLLTTGLLYEAPMSPSKGTLEERSHSNLSGGGSTSQTTELEFTTNFGRGDTQSVTTTAESPIKKSATSDGVQVKWGNEVSQESSFDYESRTVEAAGDVNHDFELTPPQLSQPCDPIEDTKAVIHSSLDPRVPKLSLQDVLPSSWLSGELTAGDTYVTLSDDDNNV